MMFKKGSFEVGGTIYPVAIKVGAHSVSFKLCLHLSIFVSLSFSNLCANGKGHPFMMSTRRGRGQA